MQQMTWRAPDQLMDRVRQQARARGQSLNEWVTTVLGAASDPKWAADGATELRERLERAGLLELDRRLVRRPPADQVATARAEAGGGTPLSQIVSDDRG